MKQGAKKSVHFHGRSCRSEFWGFAPLGLAIGVGGGLLGAQLLDDSEPLTLILFTLITFIAFVPLLSAGSRRLQDTGESGQDILLPMMPIIFAALYFSAWKVIGFTTLWALFSFPPLGFAVWLLVAAITFAVFVLCPIIGLMFLGPVIGQLLVPSDPQENKFGPNPNEVPS